MENQQEVKNSTPLVHIVDDDEAVLDSLKALLDSLGIKSASYANASEFLDKITSSTLDELTGCVVLDIRMPGMSGLECQQEMKAIGCHLPIIFLTGHGDIPMAVEAIKQGAIEFIQKPFREQQLIDCIQHAIQLSVQTKDRTQYAKEIHRRIETLTKRELQVLKSVINGHANKVIADELHLSQRTVEIHRANVMNKMQATSLAELVTMVLTQNT